VSLDGKRVSFCIVGPDFDSLIFAGTGDLISLWRKLNVGDSVLK
jgi:hypothetical protein